MTSYRSIRLLGRMYSRAAYENGGVRYERFAPQGYWVSIKSRYARMACGLLFALVGSYCDRRDRKALHQFGEAAKKW